jgi:hypothetical protein
MTVQFALAKFAPSTPLIRRVFGYKEGRGSMPGHYLASLPGPA